MRCCHDKHLACPNLARVTFSRHFGVLLRFRLNVKNAVWGRWLIQATMMTWALQKGLKISAENLIWMKKQPKKLGVHMKRSARTTHWRFVRYMLQVDLVNLNPLISFHVPFHGDMPVVDFAFLWKKSSSNSPRVIISTGFLVLCTLLAGKVLCQPWIVQERWKGIVFRSLDYCGQQN